MHKDMTTYSMGRRKSVLLSSVLSILVSFLIVASPNVETFILFKMLHQCVDFGYYLSGVILCKWHFRHLSRLQIINKNNIAENTGPRRIAQVNVPLPIFRFGGVFAIAKKLCRFLIPATLGTGLHDTTCSSLLCTALAVVASRHHCPYFLHSDIFLVS